MKTRPERHSLLLAGAVLMIAASLAVYSLLFLRWLGGKPASQPFSPRAPAIAPKDLIAARAAFREGFLDPAKRLRLAETLYAEGRWVDAFYVMREARRFFGEDSFRAAHARVFLGKTALSDDKQSDDASAVLLANAEQTARDDLLGAIPLYARLANTPGSSRAARAALDTLSKLAQRKDSDPQAEAGRLAAEALVELFKARPKDPFVFAALARASWNRGELAATRALVAETLRKDPAQAGALMMDGLISLSDGDANKAIKEFSSAWEKNPDDLYSAGELARLFDREKGDRESALPYYIALYREDPDAAVGEPLEQLISELIAARRAALLERTRSEDLGHYLSSDDASLRAQACERAAQNKDARWVEALGALLDDDTDVVRRDADYALYQIALVQPPAIRVRREEWLQSPRPLLRTRALNLFADLYTEETMPAVAEALRDPNPVVRFLAKALVFDHYYKDRPEAQRMGADYSAAEKDPAVLALYSRADKR